MYNTLESIFNETLSREGVTVERLTSNDSFTCFFRRTSDGLNQRSTMTMFYPAESPVSSGSLIRLNGENYILLNQETTENPIYYKSAVVKCNGMISTDDADVIGLPFFSSGASSAFPTSGGTSAKVISFISGEIEIITEDCAQSHRLEINDRFNAWGRTWKIQNIFFVDGICTLYADVQADTAIEYVYDIRFNDLSPSGYKIGDSTALDAVPTINRNATDGALTYTSNNTDVATIDENGIISFVGSGSVSFGVHWSAHNINKETTTTTIIEEASDILTLEVSELDEIYLGFDHQECNVTIKQNGQTVHDIPFEVHAECDFANKLTITANQESGLISVSVSEKETKLMNHSFVLVVSVPGYDLQHSQTVYIRALI